MVRFRGFQEVVLAMLEQIQLSQPQLDTKPASVARDLFIDPQAQQIADIHDILQDVASLQSIANLTGDDLTNFGFNFGATRQTGTKSNGQVIFTFRSLDSDVTIPAGSVVSTRNNFTFTTVSNVTVRTSDANSLRATATRFREDLDTAGITDTLAIEATVQAQSAGSAGNIAKYSIVNHAASNVNSVTNVISFSGGSDLESDSAFRSRILATFAGANTGTALGYRSLVLTLPDTVDALVVEPGDPVMTRDGTITTTDSDGNTIVAQPGTGGRVDVYVLGENPQAATDSFIYQDQSGRDDPTDSDNDFILGQDTTSPDAVLTLNSRRVSVLSDGLDIPTQPVTEIVSVSGSSSGSNFVEQFTDSAGNLQGNFKLVKDTGSAAGSPFGLDKMVWTSDRISLPEESRTKGKFNGIDALSFTDVLKISGVRQDIRVLNENSIVSSSLRSSVTVLHGPVRTVSRVFNLTTGERYTISDQNPDGDPGELNTTKRITISGRTLPTASDVLQVDYIWVKEADSSIDFDSLDPQADPLNEAQDSIEWGFSNYIRDELSTAILDSYGNLTVTVRHPVSRVLSINTFITENLTVAPGATSGQKTVTTSQVVTNIHSIKDGYQGEAEVFNTLEADGTFSNKLITLPSDTLAEVGDAVTVIYSLNDLTDVDGYEAGGILNRMVTLLPSTIVASGTLVRANYVADFLNIIPSTDLTSLPISSDGYNSFTGIDGYQPFQDLFSGDTVTANMRRSPSYLEVDVASIPNEGMLEFVGTTFTKVSDVFTATADDKLDLAALIRESEGLSRTAAVSTNIFLARVESLEIVETDSSGTVTSVSAEFDVTNYSIWNNRYDLARARKSTSLSRTEVGLADVAVNTDNPITTGTQIRAIFYYAKNNDSERMFFSKAGTAISTKVFAKIGAINKVSGFADSAGTVSGTLTINTLNQPDVNAAYLVDYDYTAPKDNERITINYEHNKLIQDATFSVEDGRPITADVLVKAAIKIEVDVDAKIIVLPAFVTSAETVKQNVADNISATLNSGELGSTIDASDVINNAYGVEGLDRITISSFNQAGATGTKLSLTAGKNEYLAAGDVTVTVEDR